ncbi:MAG: acyltransferase [Lachnospiraceae bacterium]|nr:acyltransferase [Lachnospiraceae bacterium]
MNTAVKTGQRNGLIDFMKFVGIIYIAVYHWFNSGGEYFLGGKFFVEFFAITASFSFFAKFIRAEQNHTALDGQYYWNYIKQRFHRLFIYTFPVFIMYFTMIKVVKKEAMSFLDICESLSNTIWEILLVKMSGLNAGQGLVNGPTWYVSALFLVEIIILGFLLWNKKWFLYTMLPLSMIIGFGYWKNLKSASSADWLGWTSFGVLRIYLCYCTGILTWFLCQRIKKLNWTAIGRALLTVLEFAGYLTCCIMMLYPPTRNSQYVSILLFTLSVAISFSNASYSGHLFRDCPFTRKLAQWSFSMYLTQGMIKWFFAHLPVNPLNALNKKFVLFLILVFVSGVILNETVNWLQKKVSRLWRKWKMYLVQPED